MIMKVVHVVVHTITIVFMTKIAYLYFSKDHGSGKPQSQWKSMQAQCIALIYVTNMEERPFYVNGMYNDEFMIMYIVIAIYLFASSRPLQGSFWFSMALGIKSGAMLLLPALLSSVMYNYGPIKLILSTTIIIIFQITIALPFITGATTIQDYLTASGFTALHSSQFGVLHEYSDFLLAKHDHSVFLTFVPEKLLYNKDFLVVYLKPAIVAVNLYYIFIRKGCLMKCLSNLASFSDPLSFSLKDRESIRNTIELLTISFFSGIVLLPGAPTPIKYWFMPFVPLLIEMIGLPVPVTCLAYQ